MNVSMHTHSHCDGLPVKVSTNQIRQLIEGEGPPGSVLGRSFIIFSLS